MARIYQMTRGQLVTLGEHAVDIDQTALWQAIDRYGVSEPVRCFEAVIKAFHYFLQKGREDKG